MQAYSDGARLLHPTFDDAVYDKAGWLRDAVSRFPTGALAGLAPEQPMTRINGTVTISTQLSASGRHRAASSTPQDAGGQRVTTLFTRQHLDIFRELYPGQLPHSVLHEWLLSAYKAAQGWQTAQGVEQDLRSRSSAARCTQLPAHRSARVDSVHCRAHRIMLPLVECGRRAIVAYQSALTSRAPQPQLPIPPPATCLAKAGAPGAGPVPAPVL